MPDASSQMLALAKPRRMRRTTQEIRALILDAARVAFAERGFAGATTRLIAARAEVAEPLIFNNFGSKSDLFSQAVIEPFATRFAEFIVQSDTLPLDLEQRNAHFVHTLYPFLRENADLLLALVKSSEDIEPAVLHGLDGYFARAAARMRSQYERAGRQFDMPPELTARYGFAMLAGAVLFRDWFFPEGAPEESVAEATLARMLFKAVGPKEA